MEAPLDEVEYCCIALRPEHNPRAALCGLDGPLDKSDFGITFDTEMFSNNTF